jgi:LL-diaminopimelate aminotransferase
MDVGVEVHSLSKGFDMIGWRIGWVCGHERIVQAFADVKDNSDSGQFGAIQNAAAFALDDDEIPHRTRTKYRAPAEKLVAMLNALRLPVPKCPAARTSSTYRRRRASPTAPNSKTPKRPASTLITQQSIVTVPWDDAGPFLLRFSVTYEAADAKPAEDDNRCPPSNHRLAQTHAPRQFRRRLCPLHFPWAKM